MVYGIQQWVISLNSQPLQLLENWNFWQLSFFCMWFGNSFSKLLQYHWRRNKREKGDCESVKLLTSIVTLSHINIPFKMSCIEIELLPVLWMAGAGTPSKLYLSADASPLQELGACFPKTFPDRRLTGGETHPTVHKFTYTTCFPNSNLDRTR